MAVGRGGAPARGDRPKLPLLLLLLAQLAQPAPVRICVPAVLDTSLCRGG